MPSLLPLLIAVHVALALALLIPSLLLPFALRRRSAANVGSGASRASGGILLALRRAARRSSGSASPSRVSGSWRPSVSTCSRSRGCCSPSRSTGSTLSSRSSAAPGAPSLSASALPATRPRGPFGRRAALLSYVMAGLIGGVGFLMSTKPLLW